MASSAHGTLTADQVATVSIEADHRGFTVVNRDQAGEIWVSLTDDDPVAEAADTFVVLGARYFPGERGQITVKLLSVGADRRYSVEAAP